MAAETDPGTKITNRIETLTKLFNEAKNDIEEGRNFDAQLKLIMISNMSKDLVDIFHETDKQ